MKLSNKGIEIDTIKEIIRAPKDPMKIAFRDGDGMIVYMYISDINKIYKYLQDTQNKDSGPFIV